MSEYPNAWGRERLIAEVTKLKAQLAAKEIEGLSTGPSYTLADVDLIEKARGKPYDRLRETVKERDALSQHIAERAITAEVKLKQVEKELRAALEEAETMMCNARDERDEAKSEAALSVDEARSEAAMHRLSVKKLNQQVDQLDIDWRDAKKAIREVLDLKCAKLALGYLRRGVGTKTDEAVWLRLEELVKE